MPTNSGNDDAEESSQSRLRRSVEDLERSLTNSVLDDDASNDIDSHGGPTVSKEQEPSGVTSEEPIENDEQRHKAPEIGIYFSLYSLLGPVLHKHFIRSIS